MTSAQIIRLVTAREIQDRLHNKAFVGGTAFTLLLLLGFIVGPAIFADGGPPSFDLGVVGESEPLFAQALEGSATAQDVDLAIQPLPDEQAATEAVESGEVDAALLDRDHLLVADDPNDQLLSIIESARQQAAVLGGLAEAGVAPAEASSLLAGQAPIEVVTPDGTESQAETSQALAFVATILLFLIIQINGTTLLTGTIEEKSSRVVEVVLGTVRPWQLLAGKLSAILLLALGQLVLFVGTAFAANAAVGAFDPPSGTVTAVIVAVVMLVLGFALYAALYAVAGSMASSLEDAQAAAGPLGFLTAGAYIGTLLGVVPNPDSLFAQVLTYFPPTAPFAVPARISVNEISAVEVVIAALVTAVASALTIRLAGRLYSAGILAGGKLTWRQVWRAEPV